MNILTIDFETYFTKEYQLGRGQMTTEEYVRDHRFTPHGASVRLPSGRCEWLTHREFCNFAQAVDWSKTAVLHHHAQFDGLILSHQYHVKPAFFFDTLSMARMLLGNHLPKGLDALARHFGLRGKTLNYEWFKGMYWHQMTRDVQQHVADGSVHDTLLTWDIFAKHLAPSFPKLGYELVDITVKMFTDPMLEGDIPLLRDIEREERERKDAVLAELGVTETDLQSAARFAELLTEAGVEVAFKQTNAGNMVPAFAKTDEFMKALCDDEDDYISALANARLGIKSTTIETRAVTLREMAERGPLCVYLSFCGAHTTRWSGGERTNFQNLKRGHRIRNSLKAPKGYKIATPDASQIECRFLNTLAGQHDVVEMFRTGQDVYCHTASAVYGRTITKADPNERGTGKQCELSCGYGSGAVTFKRTAALGTYGPPMKLTLDEAKHAVDTYRQTHRMVVQLWKQAENVILPMLAGGGSMQWGPTYVENQRIWLPNGAPLIYETLKWTEESWQLRTRNGWVKMYGAKLVENWIQAIACCKTGEDIATIHREGLRVLGMSHDEIWVLIPEDPSPLGFDSQQAVLDWCCTVIATPPAWCPEVPLGAEGKMGDFYAK